MKILQIILSAAGLIMTAAAFSGCSQRQAAADEGTTTTEPKIEGDKITFPPNSAQASAVVVEAAEPHPTATAHFLGRLVWNDDSTVRVFSPVSGRVSQIMAQPGQTVSAGAPLAKIASPDFGQAQADARKAQTDLQNAEKTLHRIQELHAHGAAAQKDLEAAQADYARALSERDRTSGRLALLGGDNDTLDQMFCLKAPLGGTVVERNLNPGQEVRSDLGNAPLFVISDPARLWIQLDTTEQDLARVRSGQSIVVRTRTYPDQSFAGQIEVVSDFLDPASRTVKVRGWIDNSQRLLKAEMFVTAELETREPLALQVPSRAVFLRGDRHCLFVEQTPGTYQRREVKIGAEQGGKIVVLSGLQANQRIVTDASLLLEQLMREGGS